MRRLRFTFRVGQKRRIALLTCVLALGAGAACSTPRPQENENTGQVAERVLGTVTTDLTCAPDKRAEILRGAWYGRATAVSRAFTACLEEVMTLGINERPKLDGSCDFSPSPPYCLVLGRRYVPCPDDPLASAPLADQIARVQTLVRSPNDIAISLCDPNLKPGSANAGVREVGLAAETLGLLGVSWGNLSTTSSEPWELIATSLWHEAEHEHGYDHCGPAAPGGMDRGDVAYAVSDCLRTVIHQSFEHCGFIEKGCSNPTALNLIDGFRSTTCACIDDPSPSVERNTDIDEDGTPDRLDNCPFAWNPKQENCNLESERARSVPNLGDACDPVPCPQTYARRQVGITQNPANDPNCSPNPSTPESTVPGAPPGQRTYQCSTTAFANRLVSDPIGSHPIDTNSIGQAANGFYLVRSVDTSTRFCQDSKRGQINCADPLNISDDQLTKWPSAAAEKGNDPTAPWHRITTGKAAFLASRDQHYSWDYDVTHDENSWFNQIDVAQWLTGPNAPQVPFPSTDPTCASGTCLGGVMWLHGDTGAGSDAHGTGLANAYFPIVPAETLRYCPTGENYAFVDGNAPRPGRLGAPRQFMLWQSGGKLRAFDARPQPETELLALSSFNAVAALRDNGSALLAENNGTVDCGGSSVGSSLKARLGTTARFLNAVEPSASIGIVDRNIMTMILSADGQSIVDRALVQGGRILANGDLVVCSDCSPSPTPSPTLARLAVVTPQAPVARREFTAFFSRAAGGVYVLGGVDASTGATLHDVWFQPVDGAWAALGVVGITLSDVRAATYSFRDKHLWVLDHGEEGRLRLVRINATTGDAKAMGSWDPEDNSQAFLSVDRNGAILLARRAEGGFSVKRLEANAHDALIVTGEHSERGRLLLAPIVSDLSYAFVVASERSPAKIVRRERIFTGEARHHHEDEDGERQEAPHREF